MVEFQHVVCHGFNVDCFASKIPSIVVNVWNFEQDIESLLV